jgi:GxxExxY protein
VGRNHLTGREPSVRFGPLGPGLPEGADEHCLAHELTRRKHEVVRQAVLPLHHDTIQLDAGYRLDLIVTDAVIIEIKATETIEDVHKAQIMT